jgi:hypothetical protein
MPNYEQSAATATRLIKDSGRAMQVDRETVASYNPIDGSGTKSTATWSIDAVVLPATIARFRGIDNKLAEDTNLILAKARYLLASAVNRDGLTVTEPLPQDVITFDDKKWRIIGVSPLRPAGVTILYQIGVLLVD